MKSKINIVIVDDQKLIRQGIKSLLDGHDHIEVLFEAANGQEVIKWIRESKSADLIDVVLMDMQMPELDGWAATEILVKRYENMKILGLSSYDNEAFIDRFIAAGGRGYLLKDQDIGEVVNAIEQVVDLGYYFSDRVSLAKISDFINVKKVVPTLKISDLSEREISIVQLICQEKTTAEIADTLFISPKTVQSHRERIMQKIKAKNVVGIVVYAFKYRLIEFKI